MPQSLNTVRNFHCLSRRAPVGDLKRFLTPLTFLTSLTRSTSLWAATSAASGDASSFGRRSWTAARELFTQRGYEAVTMREIAKRIEYSATALYGHFADKEALFRRTLPSGLRRLRPALSRDRPCRRPGRAPRLGGARVPRFCSPVPAAVSPDVLDRGAASASRRRRGDGPGSERLRHALRPRGRALAWGKLRSELDDPHLVAQTMWAIVHGVAALELNLPKEEGWLPMLPREERPSGPGRRDERVAP